MMEVFNLSRLKNNPLIDFKNASSLDKHTIIKHKLPSDMLMEEAATSIFNHIKSDFKNYHKLKFLFLIGRGNNGGDGLALLRKMYIDDCNVEFYCLDKNFSPNAQLQYNIISTYDIKEINDITSSLDNYDIIIDSIFGINYSNRNNNDIYELFNTINNSGKKILSIDVPSGLNTNNKPSIIADYLYTIGFNKVEFFTPYTRKKCGIIKTIKISFLKDDIHNIEAEEIIKIRSKLYSDNSFVHKYSKGALMIIGGMSGQTGAASFSAKAAANSGCGIISIISDNTSIPTHSITTPFTVNYTTGEITEIIDKYKTVLIGPGLKIDSNDTLTTVKNLFKQDKNFILDASFFTYFKPEDLKLFTNPPLLTPHTKEFNTFFNIKKHTGSTVQTVKEKAIEFNCYILYKSSFLILALPDGKAFVIDKPNHLAAQAGSGDILSGLIASLIATRNDFLSSTLIAIDVFYRGMSHFNKKRYSNYSYDKLFNFINYSLRKLYEKR